jgi:hypothetical protein
MKSRNPRTGVRIPVGTPAQKSPHPYGGHEVRLIIPAKLDNFGKNLITGFIILGKSASRRIHGFVATIVQRILWLEGNQLLKECEDHGIGPVGTVYEGAVPGVR